MERKWHEKTWIIVLLTVIVWPVGIFLFFKNPYYSKNVKMGALGLCVAIFAFAALTGNSDSNNTTVETKTVAVNQPQQDPEELKQQEEEKRLQREQEERERAEREAAEKARREQEAAEKRAQEELRRQEEAARAEREKTEKALREINSHSYTEVSIATLMNDLKANAARANKKYNGEYLKIIGGVVEKIESDGDYVNINTPTDDWDLLLSGVMCFPETDLAKEQVFNLNKNQRVTVYGRITRVGESLGYSMELLKIE